VDKQGLIVRAALELIREKGLSAFTQPRVATRAGLRQSHLTYYFPTRDDLLVAVLERAVADRVAALERVAAVRGRSAKVSALAAVLTDPEQTRLLLALIQSADRVPAVRTAFDALRSGIAPGSDSLLRAWGASSTPETHQLLQAVSTGIAVLALANGGPAFQDRAETLISGLLAGFPTTSRTPRCRTERPDD
jgi:AcrR family transcriptional regulator